MADDLQNFMTDLVLLLREKAAKAKRASEENPQDLFESGKHFGLYEALSLIQEQGVAFGFAPGRLGMADFDVDRDIL